MTDAVNNLPPNAQGHGLALGRADNLLQAILEFLVPGASFEDAARQAHAAGVLDSPDLDFGALADLFRQLPAGHQRQVLDNAETLPQPLREALDALGVPLSSQRSDPPATFASAQSESARADMPPPAWARNPSAATAPAVPARGDLPTQAPAPAVTHTQTPMPPNAAVAAERAAAPLPPNARIGDALAQVRPDTVPPPTTDRLQAPPPQPPTPPTVLAPQGRTDATPLQITTSQAAGATGLAAPQGAVMAPNPVSAPRVGAESTGAALRDTQLAPAGHTLATSLRRDGRKGTQVPRDPGADPLLALRPDSKRRGRADEDAGTSFQWLFWMLTVVAYGGLAIALIAMVSSGGNLTNQFGQPTTGAYALVIGGIAAAASWVVGRRLSRR